MIRLRMVLAYDGTEYAGWQIQAAGLARPTVQETVESALGALCGFSVRVHASGRTDAGVHADGQVAHVDVPDRPGLDWRRALNAHLPKDIRVLAADRAADDFHSRFQAVGKVYGYALHTGPEPVHPRLRPYVWDVPPLDVVAMETAAAMILGRRDFAVFQNAGTPVTDTVRTLWSVRREPGRAASFICPDHWPVASWLFHGDGFLKQMVRNIMGLLVWVGTGKISADDVPGLVATASRTSLPSPTAPAMGLTLLRVDYSKQ